MRWAFVIQLASDSNPSQRHFAGRIEEVDSARELRFRSTDELLIFLGDCFKRSGKPDNPNKPDNPDNPDITSDVIETANGGHVQGNACSNE
jgi:hypothetical protein